MSEMAIAESAAAHLTLRDTDLGLLAFICFCFLLFGLSDDLTAQQSRHPTHTDLPPESRQSF